MAFLHTEFMVRNDEDGGIVHNGARQRLTEETSWGAIYSAAQASSSLGVLPPATVADFTIYSGSLYRSLMRQDCVVPTTAIVRRSALGSDERFPEGPLIYEDWELFARLSRKHDAAFADVETAMNRGHRTPGRLTLCSRVVKCNAQVAMIERVWEQDAAYMVQHGAELRAFKGNLLALLSKEALLEGRPDLARDALKRHRLLRVRPRSLNAALYSVLSHAPGGSGALRLAHRSLHLARAAASRSHA